MGKKIVIDADFSANCIGGHPTSELLGNAITNTNGASRFTNRVRYFANPSFLRGRTITKMRMLVGANSSSTLHIFEFNPANKVLNENDLYMMREEDLVNLQTFQIISQTKQIIEINCNFTFGTDDSLQIGFLNTNDGSFNTGSDRASIIFSLATNTSTHQDLINLNDDSTLTIDTFIEFYGY